MQNDNGLGAYYLGIYKKLNKSVIVAKQLIECALPFKKDIRGLIKEISKTRKKLDKIFFHPELYKICNECHKRSHGGCCKNKRDSYLSWGDLIYAVAENTNFELPQPDLNFLTSLDNIVCLFLGPKNCLLKENRPIICLKQICDKPLFEEQVVNPLTILGKKTQLFVIYVFKKNKLHFFYNHLNGPGSIHITKPLN